MKNKLFGTDGIRGIAGEYPLTSSCVYSIGFHAGHMFKKKVKGSNNSIVLGRDTRESGGWITECLTGGLSTAGMQVLDAGIITTPGISYLVQKGKHTAGAVISASHNPSQYNGIKFFSDEGTKLDDAREAEIEDAVLKNTATEKTNTTTAAGIHTSKHQSGVVEYIDFLCSSFPSRQTLKGLKIVVDCANGAGCSIAPEVLTKLGAETIPVNVKPDGYNLNKNCGSLHPEIVQELVRKNNAQCGFALDGDADRVIFTDEKGSDLDGDHLLALLSVDFKNKGVLNSNILVTTIMANLGLVRLMEKHGIRVIRTAVGDRYVYESMKQHDALIGGEQSGHIILRDRAHTGDGIITALAILAVMRETGKSLSALTGIMKKYPQVLLSVPVAKKIPIEQIPGFTSLENNFKSMLNNDGRIVTRYSGTENLLRIMIEGLDHDDIKTKAEQLADIVEREIGLTSMTNSKDT